MTPQNEHARGRSKGEGKAQQGSGCGICQLASMFAEGHSGGSFQRYIAQIFVICGSTGSYKPRLGRRGECSGFFLVGLCF